MFQSRTPRATITVALTAFLAFSTTMVDATAEADAQQILDRVGSFHSQQDHLSVAMTMELLQKIDENSSTYSSKGFHHLTRPNLYRAETVADGARTTVISNGKDLFLTGPRSQGLYYMEPAPKTLDDIFSGDALPAGLLFTNIDMIWNILLSTDPAEMFLREGTTLSLGEGTDDHYHLHVDNGELVLRMDVPRAGDPVISRAVIDLTRATRQSLAGRIGEDAANSLDITVEAGFDLEWTFGEGAGPNEEMLVIPPGPEYTRAKTALGGLGFMNERAPAFEMIGRKGGSVTLTSATSNEEVVIPHKEGAPGVVVLQFWASWCGPCVASMPSTNELAGELKEHGVTFIAVNNGESAETISSYISNNSYNHLEFVKDERRLASQAYGVMGIPQISIVDADGIVRNVYTGFSPLMKELIREDVMKLVAEAASN